MVLVARLPTLTAPRTPSILDSGGRRHGFQAADDRAGRTPSDAAVRRHQLPLPAEKPHGAYQLSARRQAVSTGQRRLPRAACAFGRVALPVVQLGGRTGAEGVKNRDTIHLK